jgi:hypothetical protein
MKRSISILLALALVLSLGLAAVAQTPMPVLAASMYEHYNTGDTGSGTIFGINWAAQTFTPSATHTIISVKLLLWRSGAPGTITVGIRDTSGGQPAGSDLCSGTINGNTLTISSTGVWYEITLGGGYSLSAGHQYAIVVRAPGGDATNLLYWRAEGGAPTYVGGMLCLSGNSGLSWSCYSNWDFMFEEWGDPPVAVGWETYPINKVRVFLPWIALVAAIIAGATLLVLRRRRTQS